MISWLDQSSLVATLLHCRKALERIYILCSKAAKWDGAFFHHLWPIAVPRRSCLAAVTQQMDDLERYLKLSKIYWKIGPKNIKKLPNSVALPPGALPDLVDSRSLASASRGWFWRVRDSLLGGIISRFWCCWSDDSLIDLQETTKTCFNLPSIYEMWDDTSLFVIDILGLLGQTYFFASKIRLWLNLKNHHWNPNQSNPKSHFTIYLHNTCLYNVFLCN